MMPMTHFQFPRKTFLRLVENNWFDKAYVDAFGSADTVISVRRTDSDLQVMHICVMTLKVYFTSNYQPIKNYFPKTWK